MVVMRVILTGPLKGHMGIQGFITPCDETEGFAQLKSSTWKKMTFFG